eukprot:3020518-Rhodomonas_salina.2
MMIAVSKASAMPVYRCPPHLYLPPLSEGWAGEKQKALARHWQGSTMQSESAWLSAAGLLRAVLCREKAPLYVSRRILGCNAIRLGSRPHTHHGGEGEAGQRRRGAEEGWRR